jgi:hypothetical protein
MGSKGIDPAKLAAALGEQLAAVAPPEVEVSIVGPVIKLRTRGTPWGMDADLRPLPPSEPRSFEEEPPPGYVERVHTFTAEEWQALEKADDEARPDRIPDDEVDWILEGVLDQMQVECAENTAEPWPAIAPGPMPDAYVALRHGVLEAGYGDPASPSLTLLSVPVETLR